MTPDQKTDLLCRLTLMLDASLAALDAAALLEQRREANKRMRQITAQLRAANARALVVEVAEVLGPTGALAGMELAADEDDNG